MRLKLENPIGIAGRLLDSYSERIVGRKQVLRDDFAALDTIEEQLSVYAADMRRDFKYHLSHVENVLYAMAERGDRFFDETLSIWRVWDLVNGDKLRAAFEREVVADTSREAERHINELVDWLVEREYRQWRDLTEYLGRRASQYPDQIVGKLGSDFELSRRGLIDSVGRSAQRIVDSYEPRAESAKLLQEVQNAMIQTAAVEVSAVGLGAILVVMLHTTLLDFTGVLSAGVLAALGFYVLPYRRNKLKADLRAKINSLRTQMDAALTRQFEAELGASLHAHARGRGPLHPLCARGAGEAGAFGGGDGAVAGRAWAPARWCGCKIENLSQEGAKARRTETIAFFVPSRLPVISFSVLTTRTFVRILSLEHLFLLGFAAEGVVHGLSYCTGPIPASLPLGRCHPLRAGGQ